MEDIKTDKVLYEYDVVRERISTRHTTRIAQSVLLSYSHLVIDNIHWFTVRKNHVSRRCTRFLQSTLQMVRGVLSIRNTLEKPLPTNVFKMISGSTYYRLVKIILILILTPKNKIILSIDWSVHEMIAGLARRSEMTWLRSTNPSYWIWNNRSRQSWYSIQLTYMEWYSCQGMLRLLDHRTEKITLMIFDTFRQQNILIPELLLL